MRDIEVCAGPIDFLLSRGLVLGQRPPTIQHGLRQNRLGLLGPQVRFFHRHIERHEHGPGLDRLAGHKLDLADGAGQFVPQRDRAQRQHGADRSGRLMMLDIPGDGDRHRFHRFGLVRRGRRVRLDAAVLPRSQAHTGRRHGQEQQRRPDPTSTIHDSCPPGRLQMDLRLSRSITRIRSSVNSNDCSCLAIGRIPI
jgi:hypothetical protein